MAGVNGFGNFGAYRIRERDQANKDEAALDVAGAVPRSVQFGAVAIGKREHAQARFAMESFCAAICLRSSSGVVQREIASSESELPSRTNSPSGRYPSPETLTVL